MNIIQRFCNNNNRGSVDPLASLSQNGLCGRGELTGVDWALTPPPSDSIAENDEVVGTTTSYIKEYYCLINTTV